ncbi:MAG: DUF4981 domain-containing protein [Lachnospiraceae bacterium]|nr:DUF4981 domain-containing protein [Lachnospiraceae bacterium]
MALFDEELLKDPGFFRENTIPAHADIYYYRNEDELKSGKSSFVHLLNGLWKFRWFRSLNEACPDFYKTEYDCHMWDDLTVPSCMEMQGYGRISYLNNQYPWEAREEVEPGDIPHDYAPVGEYVKYFRVPEEFKDQPVCIRFDGAESGMALWLNGQYVGYAEDSFTPSEFDLTEFIDPDGENKLAVAVFRFTSGSWLEDQDFFRFSGLFRDVKLFTVPGVHVEDLCVKTVLDKNYKDAELRLAIQLSGPGKISYELHEFYGGIILSASKKVGKDAIFSESVKDPEKWSAERPYLYDLVIRVYDGNGALQEIVSQKVGFRSFEIKGHKMLINGKRIVFRGVNRHEFSDIGGRTIDEYTINHDLLEMKKNNINAVRTCHYPDQTHFYDMCDMLGLYVIDETNLETHGTWEPISRGQMPQEYAVPGDRKEYEENVIDRGHNMFMRDKNHPSVLIWSLGNEAYGGRVLKKLHDAFKGWDDTRPVHYEGIVKDMRYPETTDIASNMYWRVDDIRKYLESNRKKPLISCEYAHAMGNSLGGMSLYTDLADEEPLYQGGFIWDFIDQAVRTKDRYGKEYEGYGGDFGDRPHDGNFSGDGLLFAKDRKPGPKMQDVKYNYRPVKIEADEQGITITNRNLFTDVSEYRCVIIVTRNGEEKERHHETFFVPPLRTKRFKWPIRLPESDGAEIAVTFSFILKHQTLYADAGHEVAWGQYVYGEVKAPEVLKEKLKVVRGMNGIGVYGEHFSAMFSGIQGGLISYVYGGRELIEKTPRPNFWRAMTDNDLGNLQFMRSAQWKTASEFVGNTYYDKEVVREAPQISEGPFSVNVSFNLHLCTTPEKTVTLAYTVFADGRIDVDMSMPGSDDVGELPEYSLMFTLKADYNMFCWYGQGPEETYADRSCGKLGIYYGEVDRMLAPYLRPQESGAHIGVRAATVTDEKGHGLTVTGKELMVSALPYSPSEIENADHHFDLPERHYTYVRVGLAQMGVSGDDSWGARTLPQYMIDNKKKLKLHFSFRGV